MSFQLAICHIIKQLSNQLRASFVRLSDIRAVTDVSEIWIYSRHLTYCMKIRQLQRVSMTSAAAEMVLDTTRVPEVTTLYLKGTSSVHQRELIRVTAECGCNVRPAGSRRLLIRRR